MQNCLCEQKNQNGVQGLCINENCNAPLFCNNCQSTKHRLHQNECLSFAQIQQAIDNYSLICQEIDRQLQYLNENVDKLHKSSIPSLKCQIVKLIEFQKQQQLIQNEEEIIYPFRAKLQFTSKLIIKMPSEIQIQIADILMQLSEFFPTFKPQLAIQALLNTQNSIQKNQLRLESFQTEKAFSLYNENSNYGTIQENRNSMQSYKTTILSISSTQNNQFTNFVSVRKIFIKYEPENAQIWQINCFDQFQLKNANDYLKYARKQVKIRRYCSDNEQDIINFYQQQLNYDQKDVVAWIIKGAVLIEMLLHHDALIHFEKAIRQGIVHENLLMLYAKSLSYLNYLEEAVQCYNSVILQYPLHIEAILNKGLALLVLNKYTEAHQCFEIVLNLDLFNEEAIQGKKKCLIFLNQIRQPIIIQEARIDVQHPQSQ